MNQLPGTIREFVFRLTILHLAMVAGVVLFIAVSFFIQQNEAIRSPGLMPLANILVPVAAVLAVFASEGVFRFLMGKLEMDMPFHIKLHRFMSGCIIRYAVVEAGALFATIMYLLTGDLKALVIAGALVIWYFFIRPSAAQISTVIPLSQEEEEKLGNPDSEIL
jgi:hypothetical protein